MPVHASELLGGFVHPRPRTNAKCHVGSAATARRGELRRSRRLPVGEDIERDTRGSEDHEAAVLLNETARALSAADRSWEVHGGDTVASKRVGTSVQSLKTGVVVDDARGVVRGTRCDAHCARRRVPDGQRVLHDQGWPIGELTVDGAVLPAIEKGGECGWTGGDLLGSRMMLVGRGGEDGRVAASRPNRVDG